VIRVEVGRLKVKLSAWLPKGAAKSPPGFLALEFHLHLAVELVAIHIQQQTAFDRLPVNLG
jgi:hypothetical protein